MSSHTEHASEGAIEAGLTGTGGHETRSLSARDEALALFPTDVTGILKESQPARWQALEARLAPMTAATALDGPSKDGIETSIAAQLSIDTRPTPRIRSKARFGANRFHG